MSKVSTTTATASTATTSKAQAEEDLTYGDIVWSIA